MAVLIPGKIGVMGDVHANTRWTISAIREICKRLEPPKLILQAGDLGVWRKTEDFWQLSGEWVLRRYFLDALDEVLEEEDAELWFCEGNHEDHDYLDEIFLAAGNAGDIRVAPRVRWLPRGYRWEWHGRTWLACGGAVSVDKLSREEGISWFPQEEISDLQEEFIISGGAADVVLSHDAPTDCRLALGVPYGSWLPMIPRAEDHRDRLQRICVAVKPSYVFHGHYHLTKIQAIHSIWGKCRFTSLDMDERKGNWGILDTLTMEWDW